MNSINKVLLLTGCINPNGMVHTVLQDPNVRKQQYISAIRYYLENTQIPIVFVENTNTDISGEFSTADYSKRIEFITFSGNDFDKSKGKGYGEALIVDYGFTHSQLLKEAETIIKISGRHKVLNLSRLVKCTSCFVTGTLPFVSCAVRTDLKLAVSDYIWASRDFYISYFIPNALKCDESRHYWFEHALYDSIIQFLEDKNKFIYPALRIDQTGVLGSTGQSLIRSHWYNHILYFYRCLRSVTLGYI